eukprot:4534-Heterococcus_DN1.PRE.5
MVGGVCVHTGTVPSKTFREAVLHLTGYRHSALLTNGIRNNAMVVALHRGFYGGAKLESRGAVSITDLLSRVRKTRSTSILNSSSRPHSAASHPVEQSETGVVTDQLQREDVEIISGTARFVETPAGDPNRLQLLTTVATRPSDSICVTLQHRIVSSRNTTGHCAFRQQALTSKGCVIVLRSEQKAESKTSVYRHLGANLPSMTLAADNGSCYAIALPDLRHYALAYAAAIRFLIACGTRPLRPPDIPFDGIKVFDSDQLLWGGVKVGDSPFIKYFFKCLNSSVKSVYMNTDAQQYEQTSSSTCSCA